MRIIALLLLLGCVSFSCQEAAKAAVPTCKECGCELGGACGCTEEECKCESGSSCACCKEKKS